MADESERFLRQRSAVDRAAAGADTASSLDATARINDALARLAGQSRGIGAVFATGEMQEALGLARSQSVLDTIKAFQTDESLFKTLRDSLASTQLQRAALELDRNYRIALGVGENGELSTISKVVADLASQFCMPTAMQSAKLAGLADHFSIARPDAIGAAIAKMQGPWARVGDEIQSAAALGNLQALSTALARPNPYAPSVTRLLRDELGDFRRADLPPEAELLQPIERTDYYEDRGFDLALTDFLPDVFEDILELTAGEDDVEVDAEAVDRAERAFGILYRFERRIRTFIVRQMLATFGEGWEKHQVPGDIMMEWKLTRDRERDAGKPDRPRLLDYADFSHYKRIIETRGNWRAFAQFFRRKEDMQESFMRIQPVRVVTMHASLITMEDELLLGLETRRILKAISAAD